MESLPCRISNDFQDRLGAIKCLKGFIIGIFNVAGLLIFIANGKVQWAVGALLACGQGIGAWVGSHLAIQKGEKWIRILSLIGVVAMAFKLAGFWPTFS